jgi:hypothetical protein
VSSCSTSHAAPSSSAPSSPGSSAATSHSAGPGDSANAFSSHGSIVNADSPVTGAKASAYTTCPTRSGASAATPVITIPP